MATKFGQLTVLLTARTSKFAKGLKGAKTTLGRFAQSVGRMSASIAKIGLVASGAAVAGLSVLVSKSLTSIDATAKLSRSIGLTTEQLVGYQHAAAIGGATSEDVGKAFKRMQKTIADAGDGLTTAKRAFAKLGVSEAKLLKMSPDAAMKTLADAFAKLKNPTLRAAVAQDVFGRAGLKMLPMLEEGAAGLEKMQAEAARLGKTFSKDQAAGVEKANDALTRFGAAISGLGTQLTVSLAPFIEDTADFLAELTATFAGTGAIPMFMSDFVDKLKEADGWLFNLAKRLTGLEGFADGAKDANTLTMELADLENQLSEYKRVVKEGNVEGVWASFKDPITGRSSKLEQAIVDKKRAIDTARLAERMRKANTTKERQDLLAKNQATLAARDAAKPADTGAADRAARLKAFKDAQAAAGGAGGGRSGQISLTRTAIGGRSSRALGFSEQERNKNRRRGRLFAEDKARNDNWGTLAGNDKFGGLDNSRLMSKLTPIVADKREIALLTDIRNALSGGGVPAMAM